MEPNKSGNSGSKDDSARTNIVESLANVDTILVTDYNKMLEQANDRADQSSGIAGEGTSIFTMLKDTRSKGDRTNNIGGKNESSVINCSTYLFGASEMVPTITHADEAYSLVAEHTVDSSGLARQYDVVSLEASLKSLQTGLKEGGCLSPSPIRGLIQELPSPNLLMKQHNWMDSHNEECANFSFGLENKSGNDSSGNAFKNISTLGTEDESESVKSTIDDKYKYSNQEGKLLASSSERHTMSSDMTKDQVASSNFVLPHTDFFLRFSRKKLIVLDLNGLLADFKCGYYNAHTAHKIVGGKSVYKRPFCDDFLKFCFERFNVGLWSSRRRYNLDSAVDYLMGDLKHKLLFCWDQSKCTDTGRMTIDNIHKPLFLKELNKLWNKVEPELPREKGEYSASNTLLIDDSPYKAICNPPHTAIFPDPYSVTKKDDNSLGPEGDLRLYLEGLAMADDVRVYVQAIPFGQQPIADSNPSWKFYLKIIDKIQNSSSSLTTQRS